VFQATGSQPKADAITRVDFDGDFDSTDNWEDLPNHKVPGHVYTSVIESETYFFISYGFFHPRDYARVCTPLLCHENDFEGALFTVKKGGATNPFGTLILVETIAHTSVLSDWKPMTVPDPVTKLPRVALYIEPEGHGVHTRHTQTIDPKKLYLYRPAAVADSPEETEFEPTGDDAVGGVSAGNFRYTLLSIEKELWARRMSVGKGGLFNKKVNYKGTRFVIRGIPLEFNADNFFGVSKPQAPWGWAGASGLSAGELFLDPAFAVARHKFDKKDFSLNYVHHAFIGILKP
ncbi:MAG: hypothetical protein ABL958_20275, partial [Bdellovibrionia bacterium]